MLMLLYRHIDFVHVLWIQSPAIYKLNLKNATSTKKKCWEDGILTLISDIRMVNSTRRQGAPPKKTI